MSFSLSDDAFIDEFAAKAAKYYKNHINNDFSERKFIRVLWKELRSKFDFIKKIDLQFEKSKVEGVVAFFNHEEWTVSINLKQIRKKKLDDKASEIINSVYHEVRHAEQYLRVAMRLARETKKDYEIFNELDIKITTITDIINNAYKLPDTQGDRQAIYWCEFFSADHHSLYKNTINSILDDFSSEIPSDFIPRLKGYRHCYLSEIIADLNQKPGSPNFKEKIRQNTLTVDNLLSDFISSNGNKNNDEITLLMKNIRKTLKHIYENFTHESDARRLGNKVKRKFQNYIQS